MKWAIVYTDTIFRIATDGKTFYLLTPQASADTAYMLINGRPYALLNKSKSNKVIWTKLIDAKCQRKDKNNG